MALRRTPDPPNNLVASTTKSATRKVTRKTSPSTVVLKFTPALNRNIFIQSRKVLSPCEQSEPEGVLRFSYLRPDDLVVLCFDLVNLKLDPPTGTEGDLTPRHLSRSVEGQAAYLIAHHQPQNIQEEALFENAPNVTVSTEQKNGTDPVYNHNEVGGVGIPDPADSDPLKDPPVDTRMAGFSRIAVKMPTDQLILDFSVGAFFEALRTWPLSLAPTALPAPPMRRLTQNPKEGITFFLQKAISNLVEDRISEAAERVQLDISSAEFKAALALSVEEVVTPVVGFIANTIPIAGAGGGPDAFGPIVEAAAKNFQKRVSRASSSLEVVSKVDNLLSMAMKPTLKPTPPNPHHTAIELPYRLVISPNKHAAWAHTSSPVEHNGRVELWHTRLGMRTANGEIDEVSELQKNIRAIWTPDYEYPVVSPHSDLPFRASLTSRDRAMLVRLTAGYDKPNIAPISDEPNFTPLPVETHRLMLSAQGGWLDAEKSWDQLPKGIELEAWTHRASLARDHYVRVVYRGYLCPTGHAASLIKITERKFKKVGKARSARYIAYLRQRYLLCLREPFRSFPGEGQCHDGRQLPFKSIQILTTITPNLDDPNGSSRLDLTGNYSGQDAFWPTVGGSPFLFQIVAEDMGGKKHSFTMPLIFLSVAGGPSGDQPIPFTKEKMSEVHEIYNSEGNKELRQRDFGGQTIQFAESLVPGDVSFETAKIEFISQDPVVGHGLGDKKPNFFPAVRLVDLHVPAIDRLLGKGVPSSFEYYGTSPNPSGENYLTRGFGSENAGEVLFKLAGSALDVSFSSKNNGDKAGGLVTPNLSVTALTRQKGPMGGDIEQAKTGIIDPSDIFGGTDTTILGGLPLADILLNVLNFSSGDDVPKLTSTEFPDRIETAYRWRTDKLKKDPLDLFRPNANGTTWLDISTIVTTPLAPDKSPSVQTEAKLNDFKVNLFGFIELWFDNLSFKSKDGSKPDVDVDLNPGEPMAFSGPLEFVNTLREYLPADGFSDPPDLDITPEGLHASYSLGLPTIAIGIFSLQNINFGAGFTLPFNGDKVVVRFAFCERQDPFILTVSLFSGGGFFAIALNTGGVDELEAAFEFGGNLSLNVGVASGSVYIKAGIYYHWQNVEKVSELTGYVELGGSLSIIGLISVSLTFNMSLTYSDSGKVWGQATLIVEVQVLIFSGSVSVTVERQFKGSDGDPLFVEFVPNQGYWDSYCDAFAATGGN